MVTEGEICIQRALLKDTIIGSNKYMMINWLSVLKTLQVGSHVCVLGQETGTSEYRSIYDYN